MGEIDSDREVLSASLDDPAAFGVLFEEHFTDIFRYLERRVGPEPAKELAADAFAVAFAKRSSYDPSRGEVRSWLFGIATNLLRNHRKEEVTELRRRARASVANDEIEPDTEAATERLFASSQRSRLLAGLAQLDDRSRDVICLTAFADLTSAEIARALGIPPSTVRSRLWRARRRLQSTLRARNSTVPEVSPGRDSQRWRDLVIVPAKEGEV
jgi:RNA polymerase sigma-70 factor (ECF subfamily)